MPDLLIISLLGLAAAFAYIRFILKKKTRMRVHNDNSIDNVENNEPEIPPNYEQATELPPPY